MSTPKISTVVTISGSNNKIDKYRKMIKILSVMLGILILAGATLGVYIWINISKISGDLGFDKTAVLGIEEFDPDAKDLPQVTYKEGDIPKVEKTEGITDIILIGLDTRDTTKFTGRSDVTMYLRIDTNNKTLKLASFMRDTLVAIDGHNKNKLNTAFHFGSIELTKQTFYENFGLTPDYYMVVNFFGMEDIINALDGVNIEIQSNEIKYLKQSIIELNKLDKDYNSLYVTKTGMQRLNGRQAVAYMRIRKIGGDAMRMQRQQTILSELFKKANDINVGQIPALIDVILEYIRTDIPISEMLDIAKTVNGMSGSELLKFSYPAEYEIGNYEGRSIVQPKDLETEIKKLHDFLQN